MLTFGGDHQNKTAASLIESNRMHSLETAQSRVAVLLAIPLETHKPATSLALSEREKARLWAQMSSGASWRQEGLEGHMETDEYYLPHILHVPQNDGFTARAG